MDTVQVHSVASLFTELADIRKQLRDLENDIKAVPEMVKIGLLDVFYQARIAEYGTGTYAANGQLPVCKDGLDVGFSVDVGKLMERLETAVRNSTEFEKFGVLESLHYRISELESEVGPAIEVAKQFQKD